MATGTPEPTGGLDGFADKDAASGYAADALCWAVGEGLLTGKDGGRLDPAGTATRADVTRVTKRLGDEIGRVYVWRFPPVREAARER